MTSQKHLFQLPDHIHYLNGAYMSPLLRSVEEAGILGLQRKRNPAAIRQEDFFSEAESARAKFGRLINGATEQVAIIPSASYGLQSAISNIHPKRRSHILTILEEFPSDYYAVARWCQQHGKAIKVIAPPEGAAQRGKAWNERLLESINSETAAVVLSSIHWANGTVFDLQKIGARCRENEALFIVDGTQSVGVMPMDVEAFHLDALVCAAYKWLLGPYSIGLAWYGPAFNDGLPLEESWMHRTNAENFATLIHYVEDYKPGAARYSVGEYSNFALMPMLNAALDQIEAWGVEALQQYSRELLHPLTQYLQEKGFGLEEAAYRAGHLFGFSLKPGMDTAGLLATLQQQHVFVSLRGSAIRVSAHVYNTEEDVKALVGALEEK